MSDPLSSLRETAVAAAHQARLDRGRETGRSLATAIQLRSVLQLIETGQLNPTPERCIDIQSDAALEALSAAAFAIPSLSQFLTHPEDEIIEGFVKAFRTTLLLAFREHHQGAPNAHD